MAHFINLSEHNLLPDEDSLGAVEGVGKLVAAALEKAEGAAFKSTLADLTGTTDALLDHLLSVEPTLVGAMNAEEKTTVDTVEALYAVCFSILAVMPKQDKHADQIAKRLTASTTEFTEARLRLLMTLYNTLKVESRAPVFTAVMDYADAAGLAGAVAPYCDNLQSWMEDWKLSANQKRDLYMQGARLQRKAGQTALATLRRCVELYETDGNVADAATAAELLLIEALQSPTVLDFTPFCSLKAVRALGKAPLFQLAQLFIDGELSDLLKLKSSSVFKDKDVSYEVCEEKMRLLTLASVAQIDAALPLKVVQEKLQLKSEDEAEQWVVLAVRQGVLNARIDQLNRVVLVKAAFQRSFGRPEWKKLHEQIGEWIGKVEKIGTVLATRDA